MRQVEGSYGRIIGLVRRQVQKAKGPFTIRSIFEPLKREPGVVRGSVVRALQRLRKTGEVVVVKKGIGGREMVVKRRGSRRSNFRTQ